MKDTADMPNGQVGQPEILTAALGYAARGWKVFPCAPDGKAPITPNGQKDATIDPDRIRAWWAATPDANIGVHLAASGLVAIDADTYKPDCGWQAWAADHAMPATLTQRSARGGTHFLFRADAARSFPGTLCDGVDVKHRAYILVAPSRFEGKPYQWQNDAPGGRRTAMDGPTGARPG